MIDIVLRPGVYVVAVSGGVDSMVLLDILRQKPGLHLIVAHFDHGIRADSVQEMDLVQKYSMSHNLEFVSAAGHLGRQASEDAARQARYNFLRRVREYYNAKAIITAHHKDDLLETALINILRGTGWRGLSSLRSSTTLQRPLLNTSKKEIIAYAVQYDVPWRNDSTNSDQTYLRNYVRHSILARADDAQREILYANIVRQNELADSIQKEVDAWLENHATEVACNASLPRYDLIMMPHHVAHEVLQTILRRKSGHSIERPLMDRALLFVKVAKYGKVFQINADWQLRTEKRHLIVEPRPTVVS